MKPFDIWVLRIAMLLIVVGATLLIVANVARLLE